MSQTARIIQIQQMLRDQKRVSKATFLRELEISEAQFKRDLDLLRDQFRKRIPYDPKTRCYCLDETVMAAIAAIPDAVARSHTPGMAVS